VFRQLFADPMMDGSRRVWIEPAGPVRFVRELVSNVGKIEHRQTVRSRLRE
jgi:hypothetical protein